MPARPVGQALTRALAVSESLLSAVDLGSHVDAALDGLPGAFGHHATLLLLHDPARACLVAFGSRG